MMMDAPEEGGGICSAEGSLAEVRFEGSWAAKGGWAVFTGDQEAAGGSGPGAPQEAAEPIPRSILERVLLFVHLFSGLRRVEDLEWWLRRLGGARGLCVRILNFDMAYGAEYDLSDSDRLGWLVEKAERRELQTKLQA